MQCKFMHQNKKLLHRPERDTQYECGDDLIVQPSMVPLDPIGCQYC